MATVPFRQAHLPIDAVLKADGVGRSTEDWQLQNETLHKKRDLVIYLYVRDDQKHNQLFHLCCTCKQVTSCYQKPGEAGWITYRNRDYVCERCKDDQEAEITVKVWFWQSGGHILLSLWSSDSEV